jgi:exonuclease SbcD
MIPLKIFHTADWHIGKLLLGVHLTEDQRYILEQFITAIKQEQPEAIIIAGDLYDRPLPPIEAVNLLDEVFHQIVVDLGVPILAITGNHDSADRVAFGSRIMVSQGLHLASKLDHEIKPIILQDQHGEVHFHLIPYTDPAIIRLRLEDETIRNHDEAMAAIVSRITATMDPSARHVLVAHAFVTPYGEQAENTSDAERPLSIGGAEYVRAQHFQAFHYTALGHLHQAHYVANERIRYSGSPLKYSISEEHHNKGFTIIELDAQGSIQVKQRNLIPYREIRSIEARMEDLLRHEPSDDYIFVTLLDENPVLSPMEKVRSVYPNAMHVARRSSGGADNTFTLNKMQRQKTDDLSLFKAFYKEVKGEELTDEKEQLFIEILREIMQGEGERV